MGGFQNDPGTVQQEAGFGFLGNFWTESVADGLTASPTQTQAGATPLTCMFNRVPNVASPGNAVRLPPGFAGLSICVINAMGANPMTVFADTSDTINGVAGATGVSQMQNSTVWYTCVTGRNPVTGAAAVWTAQGLGNGQAGQYPTYSTQTGIVASTTQTAAAGTLITASQAQISTCATTGNAVTLPPAKPGMEITVVNNGANAAGVFGATQGQGGQAGGDTVNGSGSAFSLAVTTPVIFYCFVLGNWITK